MPSDGQSTIPEVFASINNEIQNLEDQAERWEAQDRELTRQYAAANRQRADRLRAMRDEFLANSGADVDRGTLPSPKEEQVLSPTPIPPKGGEKKLKHGEVVGPMAVEDGSPWLMQWDAERGGYVKLMPYTGGDFEELVATGNDRRTKEQVDQGRKEAKQTMDAIEVDEINSDLRAAVGGSIVFTDLPDNIVENLNKNNKEAGRNVIHINDKDKARKIIEQNAVPSVSP